MKKTKASQKALALHFLGMTKAPSDLTKTLVRKKLKEKKKKKAVFTSKAGNRDKQKRNKRVEL